MNRLIWNPRWHFFLDILFGPAIQQLVGRCLHFPSTARGARTAVSCVVSVFTPALRVTRRPWPRHSILLCTPLGRIESEYSKLIYREYLHSHTLGSKGNLQTLDYPIDTKHMMTLLQQCTAHASEISERHLIMHQCADKPAWHCIAYLPQVTVSVVQAGMDLRCQQLTSALTTYIPWVNRPG